MYFVTLYYISSRVLNSGTNLIADNVSTYETIILSISIGSLDSISISVLSVETGEEESISVSRLIIVGKSKFQQ